MFQCFEYLALYIPPMVKPSKVIKLSRLCGFQLFFPGGRIDGNILIKWPFVMHLVGRVRQYD